MVPPEAPQAVCIGLRNCYVARFGRPLKASKPPQQLSKAFERQNPPQQLSKASRLLCHGYLPRLHKLFVLGLLRGTFWAPLKSLQTPAAPFQGLWTTKPSRKASNVTTTTQRKTVTERTIATTTTQRKRNRQTHSNIQHWNALATVWLWSSARLHPVLHSNGSATGPT